jgi:predicted Zn-dependent protease
MRVLHVAVLMLAGRSLCAQQPPRPAPNGVNFYSLEKEAALGKQMAEEFRRHTAPVESPAVQDYVARLGQRIAAQVPDAKFPFTFSVIADDPCPTVHEPAALPGGYIFVPAALIAAALDEGEFAGMLAHAMEHIVQRHGTRQATRDQLMGSPDALAGSWTGGCMSGQIPQAVPMGVLPFLRSNELEADALAVQTMARTGFDPAALPRYIERVQSQTSGSLAKVFSPLPDRKQRVASLQRLIEKMPPATYAAPGEEFTAIQQEVRRRMEQHPPAGDAPTLMRRDSK